MKKIGISFGVIFAVVGIMFLGWFVIGRVIDYTSQLENNKSKSGTDVVSNEATSNNAVENTSTNEVTNNTTNENNSKVQSLTDEEMYGDLLNDYRAAFNEFDINDISSEERVEKKYDLISMTLIMHVARYESYGEKITYAFYDIDGNGIKELIVGASGSAGAIYTYDVENKVPQKIFYQDTLERGTLSIYDNGVIYSAGAGGAALHYYEFGKISQDGTYQLLEAIEEEYKGDDVNPVYTDVNTGNTLNYKNLDEIQNKYLGNSSPIKVSDADL